MGDKQKKRIWRMFKWDKRDHFTFYCSALLCTPPHIMWWYFSLLIHASAAQKSDGYFYYQFDIRCSIISMSYSYSVACSKSTVKKRAKTRGTQVVFITGIVFMSSTHWVQCIQLIPYYFDWTFAHCCVRRIENNSWSHILDRWFHSHLLSY